jgi:hypothetical protein
MSEKKFSFKKDRYLNFNANDIDPQLVGERLDELKKQHGEITPEIVADDAMNPSSVLHAAFELDEKTAARQWIIHQARCLINSIEVTIHVKDREVETPAFVSVPKPVMGGGREYKSIEDVINDEELKERFLNNMKAEMEAVIGKYEKYDFLLSYCDQIKIVVDTMEN